MNKLLMILVASIFVLTSCAETSFISVPTPSISPQIVIHPSGSSGTAQHEVSSPTSPSPNTPEAPGGGVAQMAPMVFSYSLGVGRYWIWSRDFREGEWVKFKVIRGDGQPFFVEIAFLKRLSNGDQWWRVRYIPSSGDKLAYEGLFSPDLGQLKRLRGKSDDKAPQEIPVFQGSYVRPVRLTKESIEGATVGVETVTVPAGSFTAKHVKYGSVSGSGSVEWWISDKVPGGIVKYVIRDEDNKITTQAVLVSYGTGATTELGSY